MLCLALTGGGLQAQEGLRAAPFAGPVPSPLWTAASGLPGLFAGSGQERAAGAVGPGRAFLSSAIVPGWGQYQQGRRRWLVYVGVEVAAAYLLFDRRSDARTLRRRYRDLAWEEARGGGPPSARTDGDFMYYETLTKWARSGAFDVDPGLPGLSPETDPGTFNGSIWSLAVEIFMVMDTAI